MSTHPNYDRWKTTTPADAWHLPECNCDDCHEFHVIACVVEGNAKDHPKDFQCCVDQIDKWEEEGKQS